MKEYIIWLKSGENIEGTFTDDEAKRVKEKYINNKNVKLVINDTDGEVIVDLSQISAIALNNQQINNKEIGFKA